MELQTELRKTVYSSLMAALIAAGAYIIIPIGPVPISLQTLFVLLAGLLLGRKWGTASVAIYILSGALGFPVFSGGTGGISRLFGPTGGYLIGFIPAVYIVGSISEMFKQKILGDIFAMIIGTFVIYCFGISWLQIVSKLSFQKSLVLGMYPFLIGDVIKIAAAISIIKAIRPIINKFLMPVGFDHEFNKRSAPESSVF